MLYIIAMDNLYYTELANVYTTLEKEVVAAFELPRTDLAAFTRLGVLYRFTRELMHEADEYRRHYAAFHEEELASKFKALECGVRGVYNDAACELKMRTEAIKAGLYVPVLG